MRRLEGNVAIITGGNTGIGRAVAIAYADAALGVNAALGLAALRRRLSLAVMRQVLEGTMKTTAMIMAILVGAYFLNFVIISIGLTRQINGFVTALGMSPGQTLFAVIIFYVILGMFMETLSMMVATIPIVAPIVIGAGYDPVWFGILIILRIETAMITPPVGINLYVVQDIRPRGRIADVLVGSMPFVAALFASGVPGSSRHRRAARSHRLAHLPGGGLERDHQHIARHSSAVLRRLVSARPLRFRAPFRSRQVLR